jgi:DNA-binding NtrC family response regulator
MPIEVAIEVAEGTRESLVVAEGETVLVGREPDATRMPPPARPDARAVPVVHPLVSAYHGVVDRAEGVTTLTDAGSRNGTWLRLPPNEGVQTRAQKPLVLRLSSPSASGPLREGPDDAAWVDATGFDGAVVQAITRWFASLGIPVRAAVHAQRRVDGPGAAGYIPLATGRLLHLVPERTVDARWQDALEVIWRYVNSQNAIFESEEETRDEGVVLASPAMRLAHTRVVEAARRGLRLLLIGPTGSGKDVLARCYHRSAGRSGRFVSKNCSMLSRDLMRAELFGAEKGAFTTAIAKLIGAVETAHGGTLFLDEIGELPPEVQPMLLTFLDRGEFERMGSSGIVRHSDARVVTATNRDLRQSVQRGEFRDDLWYRLAGQVVDVPPLRDRREDIEAYLKTRRLDRDVDAWLALSSEAQARVLAHPWSGNFRELGTFVARLPAAGAAPGAIDDRACAQALSGLSPVAAAPARAAVEAPSDLASVARRAMESFHEDYGHDLARWDDVKECLERYLKPLLFAQLTKVTDLAHKEDAEIGPLAQAIDADRGTVVKQLTRYFERFR